MQIFIELYYNILFFLVFAPLTLFDHLGLPVVLYSGGWINGPNKFGFFMIGVFYIIIIYLIVKLVRRLRRQN